MLSVTDYTSYHSRVAAVWTCRIYRRGEDGVKFQYKGLNVRGNSDDVSAIIGSVDAKTCVCTKYSLQLITLIRRYIPLLRYGI